MDEQLEFRPVYRQLEQSARFMGLEPVFAALFGLVAGGMLVLPIGFFLSALILGVFYVGSRVVQEKVSAQSIEGALVYANLPWVFSVHGRTDDWMDG